MFKTSLHCILIQQERIHLEGRQLPPNQAIPLVEQEGSHLYLGTSQMRASDNSLVDSEINQQALQDLECKHLWSEGSELPHLLSGDSEEPRQVWQEDLVPRRQWQEVLDNQLQMLDRSFNMGGFGQTSQAGGFGQPVGGFGGAGMTNQLNNQNGAFSSIGPTNTSAGFGAFSQAQTVPNQFGHSMPGQFDNKMGGSQGFPTGWGGQPVATNSHTVNPFMVCVIY